MNSWTSDSVMASLMDRVNRRGALGLREHRPLSARSVPLSRQSSRRRRPIARYDPSRTTYAETTAAPNDVDSHELRANLRLADPGVLVAVLAQLTGDATAIDRFGPAISHVPEPPERAGVTDPDTAEALVAAVVEALERPRSDGALAADDPGLFRRLLPVLWALRSTKRSYRCCSNRAASSCRSRRCRAPRRSRRR